MLRGIQLLDDHDDNPFSAHLSLWQLAQIIIDREDVTFGSVRLFVCLFVCLSGLSCLNRLTYDLDFWHEGRP